MSQCAEARRQIIDNTSLSCCRRCIHPSLSLKTLGALSQVRLGHPQSGCNDGDVKEHTRYVKTLTALFHSEDTRRFSVRSLHLFAHHGNAGTEDIYNGCQSNAEAELSHNRAWSCSLVFYLYRLKAENAFSQYCNHFGGPKKPIFRE